MSFRSKIYFVSIIILGLTVQLILLDWIANAAVPGHESVVRSGTDVEFLGLRQRSLSLISLSPLLNDGKTIGAVAVYDDPNTRRPEDYLEVYDTEGELVAIGWFDQFGIQRIAVDRALLEGKADLHGRFITVVGGEPI